MDGNNDRQILDRNVREEDEKIRDTSSKVASEQ